MTHDTSTKKISIAYVELLETVQKDISENHTSEVTALYGKPNTEDLMKGIVRRSLINLGFLSSSDEDMSIVNPIYEDMAGNGFLSKYLHDSSLEEINVNCWNTARVNLSGKLFTAPESFLSPQHAQDVIKRIAAKSGVTIDEAVPIIRASLSNNTRMIAIQHPIVSRNVGVVASIRRVSPNKISESELLKSNAATPEIIDFLLFCIQHGVSICFAGRTGSGKTTTANWLMSKVVQLVDGARIITIEEGSPEYENLMVRDKTGKMKNDVICLKARKSKIPEQNFDTIKLLDAALWMDPDYIVVGEMRSYEAYSAQEAARTGHPVVTTIHSNNAASAYRRMMTMAQLYPDNRLNEDMMMQLMVEAFPVIVYTKKMIDGSRRIMEVLEGVSYTREGGLNCRTLYRFDVEDTKKAGKKIVVNGKHIKVSGISENLKRTLLDNGAERKIVEKYAVDGEV